MRIDSNQPAPGQLTRVDCPAEPPSASGGPTRVECPAAPPPPKVEPQAKTAPVDRVEVSDGAKHVQRVVAEAVRAAGPAQEIRPDVVQRARALLLTGNLGANSHALANAIINDLLDRP